MTLAWAARIALALYLAYAIASEREGGIPKRSDGLRVLNSLASLSILAALVWAGWFA